MSCDDKLIYPGNSWDDKFGGEIWFKQLTSQTMAEVRVKTPWGVSEYVAVGSIVINKTYTSGTHSYKVTLQLFIGTETTALDAKTCYEALPTTGSIECKALASIDESELAATVYIDDVKFESLTPTTVLNVSPGTHTVKFTCEGAGSCLGFFDIEMTVTVVAGQTVVATARMSTSTGKISCTSTPSNASIILGKVETGQPIVYVPTLLFTDPDNPVVLSDIQQGNYSVKYFIEGYNSCTVDVTVFAGGVAYAHCTLTEETNYGKIECSTNPTGATVFLEDLSQLVPFYVNHGTTNTTLENLNTGNYNLKFTKDGYEDYITPVTVVKDVTTTVHKDLVQLLGFIRCQAYDSVTNAALNATIQIDGTTIAPTTPHTTAGLSPGSHTITFILDGYVTTSITVTVVAEETVDAYGSMVEEEEPVEPEVPGFDVNVNIPNLLPNSSLYIFEVEKVPLTDTWWDLPFGSGMHWENISNGTFKARELRSNCDPEPVFHQSLKPGHDYAIYVGTSSISFYPGTLVHHLTEETTTIDITDSYVDWLSTTLCAAFDISPEQCSNFIITSVSDAAFLLEQWKIITEHKNLADEDVTPTALDYVMIPIAVFGMFSPGLSEGKITQIVGQRFTKLIEYSKKGQDEIKDVLLNPLIDTFIMRATDFQFDELIRFLDEGLDINAHNLLDEVDKIPLSDNELHALHRGSKLVDQLDNDLTRAGSIEKLGVVLSRFSDKFRNVFHNALNLTRDNPKMAFTVGILAIWFMIDNVPFYIYMYLKSKGISPGDRSWQGKLTADVIDQYKFNTIEAEKIQAWDVFCENLLLWKEEVDTFEKFIADNEEKLRDEKTYDIYVETVAVYREAIKIKQEVHTCWHEPLPEEFDAIVTDIIDGDTIDINYNNKDERVRFLGINTPEDGSYTYSCTDVKQPYLVRRLLKPEDYCVNEELWHADEAFHIKTKEWVSQNLPKGHTATFKSDSSRQFDDHGRLLAVPFNDSGLNVCLASLRTGQSVVFFYDENKQVDTEEFLTFENIAKESNIGIWPFAEEPPETGWIKFTSKPTAAEVFLDGVKIGNTVSSILMWETTLGTHTYEFKKVGYVGCTGTILEINKTHTEDNPYEKYCALELEEPTCPAPTASFIISPTSPDVNEAITFSASASTGGGDESIKSYSWDFGDGITGSGETVTHTYTTAGGYVSKLTVENSCGESDVSTKSISVKEIILTGSLTVKTYSAPDELLNGVVVYVDNIDKGTAAVTIKDLVIGSHTVRLEKTGYLGCTYCTGNNCNQGDRISPCEFYVTIENGITKVIEVTMQKVFEIDITSVPGGATISVDGTQVEMSVKGMNIIEQILAGRAKETDVDILFKKITELK